MIVNKTLVLFCYAVICECDDTNLQLHCLQTNLLMNKKKNISQTDGVFTLYFSVVHRQQVQRKTACASQIHLGNARAQMQLHLKVSTIHCVQKKKGDTDNKYGHF